jgi:hypothetical protein
MTDLTDLTDVTDVTDVPDVPDVTDVPDVPDEAPLLTRWFAILDGDSPSEILDLISDDFHLSIIFSTGTASATDFSGDREALIGYLEQRERGTRVHSRLTAVTSGQDELFLGEVRRAGAFEASFMAAGRVGKSGRLERLLIGRSPGVRFSTPADVASPSSPPHDS